MKIALTRNELVYLFLSLGLLLFVFIKNAWVNDDAYIVFRTVEQLFRGEGAVFNSGYRVQGYTSPSWFMLLFIGRIFTNDYFLASTAWCALFLGGTIWLLRKRLGLSLDLLIFVLLLSACKALTDFLTAGMENMLAIFLSIYWFYSFQDTWSTKATPSSSTHVPLSIWHLSIACFLLILTRHDLGLLFFPPTVYTIATSYTKQNWKQTTAYFLSASIPIVCWTLFSIFYYGFAFPNTAYAKLATGVSLTDSLLRGFYYYESLLLFDLISLILIGILLFAIPFSLRNRSRLLLWL
jgi:arabinofuranosyltransferase